VEKIVRMYEIGGPEVLRYIDMLKRVAAIQGKRLPSVGVPLLSPKLSSRWLALVTDVDLATAGNLVESMTTEVIVRDHSIERLVPGELMSYDEAVRAARAAATGSSCLRISEMSARSVMSTAVAKVPRRG